MSAEKQETVSDILTEMRAAMNTPIRAQVLWDYSYRIEAAWKREEPHGNAERLRAPFYIEVGTSLVAIRRTDNHDIIMSRDHVWQGNKAIEEMEQLCTVMNAAASNSVGNAAAMREALSRCDVIAQLPESKDHLALKKIRSIIRAALSAPPRNCDVGTAEEQSNRYLAHCALYPRCKGCPSMGLVKYGRCEFAWMQMPYEREVAK